MVFIVPTQLIRRQPVKSSFLTLDLIDIKMI